ncbi:MAG: hypothetical protein LBJ96_03740 [Holosporaceae bacterium]|nr:hypothetical protein [Holosporaceae bacterium]
MKKIMLALALAAVGMHNCYAVPEDWEDGGKYGENIKFLSDFLKDYKAQGYNHPMFRINLKNLYTENDIKAAWSDMWIGFTKNVVRVNIVEEINGGEEGTDEGICLPGIGTGTLIDVGVERLKGKVVITCAHNVINIWGMCGSLSHEGHLVLKTGEGDFFPRCGNFFDNNTYLSVTPEPKRYNGNLPLICTIGNTRTDKYKVKRSYIYRGNGKIFDLAILILDDQVKDEGGNVLSGEQILAGNIFGYNKRERVTGDDFFYVVGYGMTGWEQTLDGHIGTLLDAVKEDGQLKKRHDLLQLLGWNKKKCIQVLSQFVPDRMMNKSQTFVDADRAGGGFSGSLVVKKTDAGLEYVGIYSGPLFKLPGEKVRSERTESATANPRSTSSMRISPGQTVNTEPEYKTPSDSADICEFIKFVKREELKLLKEEELKSSIN